MLRRIFLIERYARWDTRTNAGPTLLAAILCLLLGVGIALVPALLQILVAAALLATGLNLLMLAIAGFAARRQERTRGDDAWAEEWRRWWLSAPW